MAKISVIGYEVSSDPGIQNISSYEGEIDTKDVQPDTDLEKLITNPWWRNAIGPKFAKLSLVELQDTGARFRYGENDFFLEFGESKQVDKVGLSYAYGELYVKMENNIQL